MNWNDYFKNEKIKGVHISRIVMSYYNEGGKARFLVKWLRQLTIDGEYLTEEEIARVRVFAQNGKLEIEQNARSFVAINN